MTTTTTPAETPKVPIGPSTLLGIVGLVGAIIAGIQGYDVGVVIGGLASIATIVSRGAQAVALARTIARQARPWVNAVADLPER